MVSSSDKPTPSWLIQEPEGQGAPKTPGRWKTLWATDCARLEEAHQRGDQEVLVYGRKYVVDMKERTVRPLYWDEKPSVKPIIRATYFLQKGGGWLPYSEKDAQLLEDTYAAAKIQLRSSTCSAAEIPLTDGENKVVMTRMNASESVDDYFADFDIAFQQKRIKAPSLLAKSFFTTAFEVQRGSPEPSGWGGTKATEGDKPIEGETAKHLCFVVHGMGESMWSRSSSSLASLRASMGPMRAISAEWLAAQRKAREAEAEKAKEQEEAAAANAAAADADTSRLEDVEVEERAKCDGDTTASGEDEGRGGVDGDGDDSGGGEAPQGSAGKEKKREKGEQADRKEGEMKQGGEKEEEGENKLAEFVEFLPVEWFDQVHGRDAVCEEMMQDISLPSIPGFRDFASQAIMDVMYYLTPEMQAAIVSAVGKKMNKMWETFTRVNPGFTGKVSIVAHSLGSIITHDILAAQPVEEGSEELDEGAISKAIPILSFRPEVLLACGSPIGMFLALRQSTLDRKKLFKFNTTKRFFNLFHPTDPVAYRLEPLLDKRLRDLPPEHVPHRGGDRIHVSMTKFNRGVNAAIGRVQQTTGAGWQAIQRSINTTIKSAIGDPNSSDEDKSAKDEEVSDAREHLAERIDWVIQESTLEGMHPWASAIFAHSSYFSNFDMIMFLVNRLNEGLEQEEAEGAGGQEKGEEGGMATAEQGGGESEEGGGGKQQETKGREAEAEGDVKGGAETESEGESVSVESLVVA